MEITTKTSHSRIILERDCRNHIRDYIDVDRKILIISDEGVPYSYVEDVRSQCPQAYVHIISQGEESKSLEEVKRIALQLLKYDFTEQDLIFAIGGGVVGDLSGFVASAYRCGIPYVSLPTTTLSQIDSSIGGKTAVNLNGVKNVIGSLFHPQCVLIDLNTLKTLHPRQYYSGLIEAIKAGMIRDPQLFAIFEQHQADFDGTIPPLDLEEIIERALIVKKEIVEEDEKETGMRKLLNFGHTIGHGIESIYHLQGYTHGESVGIGMMMILRNPDLRQRLESILKKMNLSVSADYEPSQLMGLIAKDKKADGDHISIVQVDVIGQAYTKEITLEELADYIQEDIKL